MNWTRLNSYTHVLDGLPVKLHKYKVPGGHSWFVQVPMEPDPNYADGWAWMDAWNESTPDGYPERLDAGGRITAAMDYVREHLDAILAYAAKQQSNWPHIDTSFMQGARVLQYLPDGRRLYTTAELEAKNTVPEPQENADAENIQAEPATEETQGCACGCGTPVQQSRVYAAGHDARHRDHLVDLLVGRGTVRDRANRIQHLIDGLTDRP